MDAQEYAKIIKLICLKLEISSPDTTLIRNVTHYCKSLDQSRLKRMYFDEEDRHEAISDLYIQSVTEQTADFDYNQYLHDSHQHAKKQKQDEEGQLVGPLTNWIGKRMPVIASKSMSICIDSRLRNASNSTSVSITDFGFTLVPRMTRASFGDGRIQSRIAPSHITYFKVGKVILPYSEVLRSRNFANEITLTFTALRSNGIVSREDTYHFAFTYSIIDSSTNLVQLTPLNEYCKFEPPLRTLDDLSLRFNDPIFPISFHTDRLIPTNINYMSSDGRITFDIPHFLNNGDVIIVMGLKTNADAANASLLNTINDPRGIRITKIDDNTIATSIDFTKIVSQDITSLPTILFFSRTFRMPLEIGYQDVVALDE